MKRGEEGKRGRGRGKKRGIRNGTNRSEEREGLARVGTTKSGEAAVAGERSLLQRSLRRDSIRAPPVALPSSTNPRSIHATIAPG